MNGIVRSLLAVGLVFICVSALSLSHVEAQTDLYLSYSAFGDGGAFENDSRLLRPGDSVSAYLWVDGKTSMDISTEFFVANSSPDLVVVDKFEVLNPDVVFIDNQGQEFVLDQRWSALSTGVVNDNYRFFTTNIGAGGLGIRSEYDGSGVLTDLLYDPTSSAFLYGRIDFTVVGTGEGNFTFSDDFGSQTLAWDSEKGIFAPTTRGLSFNSASIPEPASSLLVLVTASFVAGRRHRRI